MKIKVAEHFSKAPGPRYRDEGKHSGEEFRIDVLYPMLQEAITSGQQVSVDLDGTFGFGTSFLEESFGGLIRENGLPLETVLKHIEFISIEEPELLDEIRQYMDEAERERK